MITTVMTLKTVSIQFFLLETATLRMKRIFGRSGREKEEEIQDVSLDILLAHKEDVITKVATKTSFI